MWSRPLNPCDPNHSFAQSSEVTENKKYDSVTEYAPHPVPKHQDLQHGDPGSWTFWKLAIWAHAFVGLVAAGLIADLTEQKLIFLTVPISSLSLYTDG